MPVFGRELGKATGSRFPGAQPRMLRPGYQRDAIGTALTAIGRQQAMNLQPDPTMGAPFSSFPDNRLTVAQMGPGQPAENFPLGGEPRQYQYRVGRNFPTPPDAERAVPGDLLRSLADASWLVRKCLEIRKGELCSLDWDIVPAGRTAPERQQNRLRHGELIAEVREFFRYPEAYFTLDEWAYGEQLRAGIDATTWRRQPLVEWTDWLNACLEDVFVGDWLSLWPQRTLGDEMLGLRRVDGKHIKVIIDLDGRLPPPPMPAFQQYLYGVPRASWSADEFYFLPRNLRNMTTFGFSLVQQCLVAIDLALKFDQWNVAAYSASTMPMGLLETPQGMTAAQIQDMADLLNGAVVTLAARQQIHPVPFGTKFQPIKPFVYDAAFALYVVEMICACMEVPPQELGFAPARAGMGGSGHAEVQNTIGRRKTLLPTARWWERKMTQIIRDQWRRMGGAALEFCFTDLVHAEAEEKFDAYKVALESGQVSLDELMEEAGEAGPGLGRTVQTPQGTVFVDKGFVLTSNGIVPLRLPNPGEPSIFGPHEPPQAGERAEHPGAGPAPAGGDAAPKAALPADLTPEEREREERRRKREKEFLALWLLWWGRRIDRAAALRPTIPEMAHRALELTFGEQDHLALILQDSLRGPVYADAAAALRAQAGLPPRASGQPARADLARLQTGSQTHIVQVAQTYQSDLMDAYQRLLEQTETEPDQAKRSEAILKGLADWARERAEWKGRQVAATEATDAESQASRDFATANPRNLHSFRWRAVLDDLTCEACRNLDGQIVGAAGPHPPAHPNCLLGNTRVVASGVSAASKRWYDGDLVVIRTASGKKLACTPNHPILTPGGWVAARFLHKGGYVISSGLGQWGAALVVNEHQDMPPTIEEVTDALGRSRGVASAEVPLSSEDFHGDGEGSKVAVVWTDGLLLDRVDPKNAQPRQKANLCSGGGEPFGLNSPGSLGTLLDAGLPATNRCVRCGRELRPILLAGVGHADEHGIAAASDGDSGIGQDAADRSAGDAEGHSKGLLGLARDVPPNDLLAGKRLAPGLDLLGAVPLDLGASGMQALEDGAPESVELAREILTGASGPVFSDEIVNVDVDALHGFVFNLQTASGAYVAEGIVTHNCRCTLEPVEPNTGNP